MNQAEQLRKRADELDRIDKQRQESIRLQQEQLAALQAQLSGYRPPAPQQAPIPEPGGIVILQKLSQHITPADQMYISEHANLIPDIFASQEGRDILAIFMAEMRKLVESKKA